MLPSSASQRTRAALLGIVGAVAAFFVFGGARSGSATTEPLDAVPRDSFLVATLNLAELRQSPLYEVLLGKEGGGLGREGAVLDPRALGIGKLADACGFDPLARVERLAIGLPEEGDKGELGVAARVTVSREELSRCAESMAGKRGGKVEAKEVGGFAVLEDTTAASETARPRLGFGHGALLVVGRGAWFDAMLATADGKRPGARTAEGHAAIRASLTGRDGWHAPTLVVTALLPKSLRDRLRGEMAGEVAQATANADGKPEDVMAGVLGVGSVGVALRAGSAAQSTDVAVELTCDAENACVSVEKLVLKKRFEWSKELMLRMVGLGPLLDSIEVKREKAKLRVTAGAPAAALAATFDRVLRFSGRGGRGGKDAEDVRPPAAPVAVPKETIPAPRPSP